MQQRRLRLGDILDDYCPRERRVTNHAIVALIEDEVKQTRCTTCDAEHEYKQARVPAPRRKKADVSAGARAAEGTLRARPAGDAAESVDAVEPVESVDAVEPGEAIEPGYTEHEMEATVDELDEYPAVEPQMLAAAPPDAHDQNGEEPPASLEDEGPVHRRLIRATLPRPEGQVPERKLPDFTIRQPGGRGGREADGNRMGGQRPQRGSNHPRRAQGQGGAGQPSRFGPGTGPRQGHQGQGHQGQGHQGQGGGRQGSGHGQGQRPGKRSGQPDGGGGHRGGGGRPGGGQGHGRGGGRKRGR